MNKIDMSISVENKLKLIYEVCAIRSLKANPHYFFTECNLSRLFSDNQISNYLNRFPIIDDDGFRIDIIDFSSSSKTFTISIEKFAIRNFLIYEKDNCIRFDFPSLNNYLDINVINYLYFVLYKTKYLLKLLSKSYNENFGLSRNEIEQILHEYHFMYCFMISLKKVFLYFQMKKII